MKSQLVTPEIRKRLCKKLGIKPGEASIRRKRTPYGDEILVIAYPDSTLVASDIPTEHEGYLVKFERHPIPKASSGF